MKKVLILLLILGVAGGIFAQELTWSGKVQSGFQIDLGDDHDDPIVYATDDDVPTAAQARLNLNVAGDNWGFALGTGANVAQDKSFDMVFGNAHGWIDFLDGMVKLRAGLIDPGVWGTGGEGDWNLSSGVGTRLEIMPLGDKLNFGFMLNYWDSPLALTVKDWLMCTAFGASYNDPDTMGLKFSIAMKMSPEGLEEFVSNVDEIGYDEEDESTWIWDVRPFDANSAAELIFAFGISPIPELSVLIDGHVQNLGQYGDAGLFTIYEEVTYTGVENLSVGLLLGEGLSSDAVLNGDKGHSQAADTGFDWVFVKPWLEYAVTDSISAGLGIPIALSSKVGDDGKADGMGLSNFGADLWGKYTVGGAFAKLGYGFTNIAEDFAPGGESTTNHYVRMTFGFEF